MGGGGDEDGDEDEEEDDDDDEEEEEDDDDDDDDDDEEEDNRGRREDEGGEDRPLNSVEVIVDEMAVLLATKPSLISFAPAGAAFVATANAAFDITPPGFDVPLLSFKALG